MLYQVFQFLTYCLPCPLYLHILPKLSCLCYVFETLGFCLLPTYILILNEWIECVKIFTFIKLNLLTFCLPEIRSRVPNAHGMGGLATPTRNLSFRWTTSWVRSRYSWGHPNESKSFTKTLLGCSSSFRARLGAWRVLREARGFSSQSWSCQRGSPYFSKWHYIFHY